MAFKNDIAFWKEKDSMEGISIKSLYINLVMNFIIVLYLVENETSILIVVPTALSLPLDLWKINRASKIEKTSTFPYFRIVDKDTYVESDTKVYDDEAMRYMSYFIYPALAA